ncbi:MAG: protein-export chaperone SecB [Pseudomonadota bacterium]
MSKDDEIDLKVGRDAVDAVVGKANQSKLELVGTPYIFNMSFVNHEPVKDGDKKVAELGLKLQRDSDDPSRAVIEFEVMLAAKNKDGKECFVLKLSYVGLFIIDKDEKDAEYLLSVKGATKLYPHLQAQIGRIAADTRCGMKLSDMDFEAAYKQQKAKK